MHSHTHTPSHDNLNANANVNPMPIVSQNAVNTKDNINKEYSRTDTNLASQLRRTDKERVDRNKNMTPNRYEARHPDKQNDKDRIIKYERDHKFNTESRSKD